MKSRLIVPIALLGLFLLAPSQCFAQGNGKKGGGGGSDDGGDGSTGEPSVLFQVTWLTSPVAGSSDISVWDINNNGSFVGHVRDSAGTYTAFLGSSDGLVAIDSLPGMSQWTDDGWRAEVATGISDTGFVAVSMSNSSLQTDAMFRYSILDATAVPIQEGAWGFGYVNNFGEMAFNSEYPSNSYLQLYVAGQVVTPTANGSPIPGRPDGINDSIQAVIGGDVYNYLTDSIFDLGSGVSASAINAQGDLAVRITQGPKTKPGKYVAATGEVVTLAKSGGTNSINDDGDVLALTSTALTIFLAEGNSVTIDSEVVGTDEDVAIWNSVTSFRSSYLNNRDATGFGQVVGKALFSDGSYALFFLIPQTP